MPTYNNSDGTTSANFKIGPFKIGVINTGSFEVYDDQIGLTQIGCADPIQNEHVVTKGWALLNLVPVGTILGYAGDIPPIGFIWCDGLEIDRTSYADLFSVIGTKFGAGNGTTTFNVPDFRDKVSIGDNLNTTNVGDSIGATDITTNNGSYLVVKKIIKY